MPHGAGICYRVSERQEILEQSGLFAGIGGIEVGSLVAGGFPCQDLSPAGRPAGIHGKNSGLVNYV